jgi:hypothetical protein
MEKEKKRKSELPQILLGRGLGSQPHPRGGVRPGVGRRTGRR